MNRYSEVCWSETQEFSDKELKFMREYVGVFDLEENDKKLISGTFAFRLYKLREEVNKLFKLIWEKINPKHYIK